MHESHSEWDEENNFNYFNLFLNVQQTNDEFWDVDCAV